MNKSLIFVLSAGYVLLIFACENRQVYRYKDSSACSNLGVRSGLFYPKEVIYIYFNDELIFKDEIDSLDGYHFRRGFCLKYTANNSIRIVTKYSGKTYIDESFEVKDPDLNYELSISYPHPFNWRELFNDDNFENDLYKGWGYLPKDSGVRFISLHAKNELIEPFDTILMRNIRESIPGETVPYNR